MFRPCIDIHDGAVKQIVGGTLTESTTTTTTASSSATTNFISTQPAAYFSELYKAHNLRGGHVIKLGNSPATEEQALAALRAYPNGLQIGGGVTPANAQHYLNAGATHVIVTSYVFRNGTIDNARLDEMIAAVGTDKLVLDLSCRYQTFPERPQDNGYYVVTDRWQKFTTFQITSDNVRRLESKCSEFLVHGVDVEGLRCGIQEDLVLMLSEMCNIPVTYAGGAKSLEDLKRVKEIGRGKVDLTIGSALDIFGGELKWEDVMNYQKGNESNTSSSSSTTGVASAAAPAKSNSSNNTGRIGSIRWNEAAVNNGMGEDSTAKIMDSRFVLRLASTLPLEYKQKYTKELVQKYGGSLISMVHANMTEPDFFDLKFYVDHFNINKEWKCKSHFINQLGEMSPGTQVTSLAMAAIMENETLVAFLLHHGADVGVRFGEGTNVFHFACYFNKRSTNTMKMLLSQTQRQPIRSFLNTVDNHGETPLDRANIQLREELRKGGKCKYQMELIQLLEDNGADSYGGDDGCAFNDY